MKIAGIELDEEKFPGHIGVIMDGNSRWAERKGYSKLRGHRAGMRALKKMLSLIEKTPIACVTLFAFSKENWKRPEKELEGLFNLLRQFYKSEYPKLRKRGVKILHSGDYDGLADDVIAIFETMVSETADNKGKIVNLAMNYSGRDELARTIKKIMQLKRRPKEITEDLVASYLDHPEIGDVDLVIRTSGEERISNFCLWQLAYAELFFLDVLWPDFSESHFAAAIAAYQQRDRRFGGRKI